MGENNLFVKNILYLCEDEMTVISDFFRYICSMLSESPPRKQYEQNANPIEMCLYRCRLSHIGLWFVVNQDSV